MILNKYIANESGLNELFRNNSNNRDLFKKSYGDNYLVTIKRHDELLIGGAR